MTKAAKPETLIELLKTLESSREIRSLARECGLTIREFRRRIGVWRRDLVAEEQNEAAGTGTPDPKPRPRKPKKATGTGTGDSGAAEQWPVLTIADEVKKNPLPARGSKVMEIHSDGASKGNPGPASIGVVFSQKDGPDLCTHSEAIGKATNNVAEYRAVLKALEFCQQWGVKQVNLLIDSELVVRQLTGAYRVKSPDLSPLYQQAVFLIRKLKSFRVHHVPRQQNAFADHLANLALKGRRKG